MFIWNADRKILLLPATLYEKDENYRTTDYYNGLFAIKIDANTGVQELAKATHIDVEGLEEKRKKECEKYSGSSRQPVCRELLNGELHCEIKEKRRYVPEYCYKGATLWQYIGDKSWEFRDMQIKRALYIGDKVYALSDNKIGSYDWNLKLQAITSMK